IRKQTYIRIVGRETDLSGIPFQGGTIQLRNGKRTLARTTANGDGEFVFLVKFASKAPQRFTLRVWSVATKMGSKNFIVYKPAALKKPTPGLVKESSWKLVTLR